MINSLVLFCGGPAIYGGVPKPLQMLRTGETLIERYLNFVKVGVPSRVVLLIEHAFEGDYCALLDNFNYPAEIVFLNCPDNSSTLTKLKVFLDSCNLRDQTVMFSYPDIFIDGQIDEPSDADSRLTDRAFISFIPVISRFPRLVIDVYGNSVQGISCHTSPVPANPLYVFGGHLLVRTALMNSLVNTFLAETSLSAPSLEFDMFFWLINTLRMHSMPIHGRWIQADSPREIETILSLT